MSVLEGLRRPPSCHPKGAQGPRSGPQHSGVGMGLANSKRSGRPPRSESRLPRSALGPGGQGHTHQRKAGRPTVRTRDTPHGARPAPNPLPPQRRPRPRQLRGTAAVLSPSCPWPWTTDDSLGTSDLADGLGRLLAQVQPKTPPHPREGCQEGPYSPSPSH